MAMIINEYKCLNPLGVPFDTLACKIKFIYNDKAWRERHQILTARWISRVNLRIVLDLMTNVIAILTQIKVETLIKTSLKKKNLMSMSIRTWAQILCEGNLHNGLVLKKKKEDPVKNDNFHEQVLSTELCDKIYSHINVTKWQILKLQRSLRDFLPSHSLVSTRGRFTVRI